MRAKIGVSCPFLTNFLSTNSVLILLVYFGFYRRNVNQQIGKVNQQVLCCKLWILLSNVYESIAKYHLIVYFQKSTTLILKVLRSIQRSLKSLIKSWGYSQSKPAVKIHPPKGGCVRCFGSTTHPTLVGGSGRACVKQLVLVISNVIGG